MGRKTGWLLMLVALALLAVLVFTGCLGSKKTLVGRWDLPETNGYIIFEASGDFTWLESGTLDTGSWRTEDDKLFLNTQKSCLIPHP